MNTINILVVEDEALVAAMIKEALSKTKYTVRAVAFNKASAEKYLSTEPIDAALLDINLEGNFEGIEIGRTIRDQHHIPFLYITAHADDQTLHNAKLHATFRIHHQTIHRKRSFSRSRNCPL